MAGTIFKPVCNPCQRLPSPRNLRGVEESKQGGATEVELALRNFKSSRGVKTGWSNRDRANDYNPRYAFVLL